MNRMILAIINTLSVVLVLGVNYYSQIYGINGNRVGELSGRYDNLFTPASYAFSIWGIIFLMMIFLVSYQLYTAFFKHKSPKEFDQMGLWFSLTNVGNASWVIVWLYEWTFLSVVVMSFILISLLRVVVNINLAGNHPNTPETVGIYWPISIYSGWISVAIVANIAAYLSKLGWQGEFLGEDGWAMLMILIATLIYGYMVLIRNMSAFAMVGIWALLAIYIRQQEMNPYVGITAVAGASALFLLIILNRYRESKRNRIKIGVMS